MNSDERRQLEGCMRLAVLAVFPRGGVKITFVRSNPDVYVLLSYKLCSRKF